jgi:hypothetical protein
VKHPIPAEALKESVAIVGRTGSGKSYAAKGAVETLLRDGGRVCIIDPTGVWYGLRSSADGLKPAFPVVVFGGDHADVAIAETSGAPLAELLAGRNLPAIVDLSEFTMGARVRFATAFFEELYRSNRQPLTLVVDEADIFAPQRAMPDQTVMLSRMEQICRRGRVRGFRAWLITQRPAELHKSVLSQANTLIAMQLTAPQDRDAIGAWIEGQADRESGKTVLASLPRLQKGEGYVWSPSHDVLARVRFPRNETFDSGRTPEEGETPPRLELADVDLAGITESMKAVEAEAAANDPKALRKRVAELERELAKGGPHADVNALEREFARGYADCAADALVRLEPIANAAGTIFAGATALRQLVELAKGDAGEPILAYEPPLREPPPIAKARQKPADNISGKSTNGALPRAEREILRAIAQRAPKSTTRAQASILSGYSVRSSSFSNALGALRTMGYVDGRGDDNSVTDAGIAALGKFEPMPTGIRLVSYWQGRLPKAEAALLDAAVAAYPKPITRDALSRATGYSTTSSSFSNAIGALRGLQLLHGRGDDIRASADLFE